MKRKQLNIGKPRSRLFYYRSSRDMGVSHTELAGQIDSSVQAVSQVVERGEAHARMNSYKLIEHKLNNLRAAI
jgi:hypothetical protein